MSKKFFVLIAIFLTITIALSGSATPAVAADTIVSKIKTSHPYLYATNETFNQINSSTASDTEIQNLKNRVIATADRLLTLPVVTYSKPDGIRLLSVSITVKSRAFTLGMAYKTTGDKKYAERLWKELETVTNFPDWNPKHFLDTAEMTHGVSVGYDWIYDYLTPVQRNKISASIVEKGLKPALTIYKSVNGTQDWLGNQNIVNNGGIGIGALAVGLEYPELSETVLQYATADIKKGMEQFNPDGGFSEGIGYWSYSMEYAVAFIATLNSAVGTDYNLSQSPGFSTAGMFPLYIQGPNRLSGTSFNYGDADSTLNSNITEYLYLGKTFNNSYYNNVGSETISSSDPKALLWYNPKATKSTASQANVPLDKVFQKASVYSMISGFDQKYATFVSTKSRGEKHYHDDTDVGDFVMSSMGEAWAVETGKDQYTYAGLDTYNSRWDFYRKRAEGQNTMVFNAEQKTRYDQVPQQILPFTKTESSPTKSFVIGDYTPSTTNGDYTAKTPQTVTSWKRGVMLFDNRQQVLIQDEVVGSANLTSSWWFMHTAANIEVAADGKSAILSKPNGKKLVAKLVSSDTSLVFTSMSAEALPTSNTAPNETPNTGLRKLAVNIVGNKNYTIAVQLSPVREGVTNAATEKIVPLSQWKTDQTPNAQVKNININGQPLANFNTTNLTYDVDVLQKTKPVITVTKMNVSDTVTIVQPVNTYGKSVVTVSSAGKQKTIYTVFFHNTDTPVTSITASATYKSTETPEMTQDNNVLTKWSAWGKQWIQYDFGSVKPLEDMNIFWGGDKNRIFNYQIDISQDGKIWTNKLTKSFPVGAEWEKISLNSSTRYVRITLDGDKAAGSYYRTVNEVTFTKILPTEPKNISQVNTIKLSTANATLQKNTTAKTSVTGWNLKGAQSIVDTSKITYTSTNPVVVTVDSKGVITGRTAGSAIVYATYKSSDRIVDYSAVRITVTDPNLIRQNPSADVYVNGGPNANKVMTGNELFVKTTTWDPATDRKTFMEFNIPQMAGKKIISAKLTMYPRNKEPAYNSASLDIYQVSQKINESTTTYNNQPSLGTLLGSMNVDNGQTERSIDVTSYVKNKTGYITFGLDQKSSVNKTVVGIPSRESSSPATLDIIFG